MSADPHQPSSREFINSKARFITELEPRIRALRQGLTRVGATDHDLDELNAVKRRIHALAAASQVLDFSSASSALAQAEAALVAAGSAPMAPLSIERVTRILDALPTLVLGGSVPLTQELDSELNRPLRPPFTLAVFGQTSLAQALQGAGPLQDADYHETLDPAELLSVQQTLGPDAVLLDGDLCSDGALVEQVTTASGAASLPVVVVCSFDDPQLPQRLLRAGASRVLPKPVDAWVLQRTLRQACVSRGLPSTEFSSFARLTPIELAAAISNEARRALVDAIDPALHQTPLNFQNGAPLLSSLWTALARIRALASQADPSVHFAPTGPSGSIPLCPTEGQSPLSALRSNRGVVPLEGRVVLVVHPDEGVRASLSRLVEPLGVRTVAASDLEEAQFSAHSIWPDAILCGPHAPSFEGLELAHEIERDIALADVPVLLLSEPLSTPLKTSPSIAPFLKDALSQRSLLESRLQTLPEVHGRLDGLTPRLVLELAARYRPNCTLSLRSGSLRFEVSLQEGNLTLASLHRDGREVARDQDVLGPLLGARTGRYRVLAVELIHPVEQAAPATLRQTLQPSVDRARLARRCLSPSELTEITRVVLDPSSVSQYLTECPRPVRAILTQLGDGTPPIRLLERGESITDTTRVHTTLEELCRRGAVVAIFDSRGEDRLAVAATSTFGELAPPTSLPTPPLPSAETLRPASGNETLREAKDEAPELELSDAVFGAVTSTHSETGNTELPAHMDPRVSLPTTEPNSSEPSEQVATDPEGEHDKDTSEVSTHAQAARQAWQGDNESNTDLPQMVGQRLASSSSSRGRALAFLLPVCVASLSALCVVVASRYLLPADWRVPEPATATLHPPATVKQATPPPAAEPEEGAGTLEASSKTAVPATGPSTIVFESEELPLPASTRLLPNHGLLEIHSWANQRISIDGVFMGKYRNRRVPLTPGSYTLHLGSAESGISHRVTIAAGKRLRVVARQDSTR